MYDSSVIITGIIGAITTIISGWTSYFFTRKKYNSEVDLNLIEKMQKSLDFYVKLAEENKKILGELTTKLEESEKKNEALEQEIRELRGQMFNFMSQVCTDLTCKVRKEYTAKKKTTSKKEGTV